MLYADGAGSAADSAVAQAALAGGMFQSLVSTAIGLALAIPSYLVYLYLYGKAQRMLHRLERAGIETVNIVCDSREHDRIVSFRDSLEQQATNLESKSKKVSRGPKIADKKDS